MIQSFSDRETEKISRRIRSRKFSNDVQRRAYRKLVVLDAAESLHDLQSPPGDQLEKLSGDRAGEYSIRINNQWRVCFRWQGRDAYEVAIVDYH